MSEGPAPAARTPWLVRWRIRPPLLAAALVLAALALDLPLGLPRVVPWPWRWAGAPLALAGLLLAGWGLLTFHRHRTTHEPFGRPATLVTSGPYRYTRNPMYVGVTALLLGAALLAGSLPLLATPLLFAAALHAWQIPFEEARLARLFGDAYATYRARVRRW